MFVSLAVFSAIYFQHFISFTYVSLSPGTAQTGRVKQTPLTQPACTHFEALKLYFCLLLLCERLIDQAMFWQDVQSLSLLLLANIQRSLQTLQFAFLSLHGAPLSYSLFFSLSGPVIRVMMRDFLCSVAQYQSLS